jgi:toxin CptA
MDIMIRGLAFALAALCAAVMGLAIQRGATCTVAAVDELVQHGSPRRLVAMLEAAAWVGGGLVLLQALHAVPRLPAGAPLGAATVAGAVLLGLGAWVNRACVFGAVARFGSGEWAYAATPVGFYAGCLAGLALMAAPGHDPSPASLMPAPPAGLAWLAGGLLLARVAAFAGSGGRTMLQRMRGAWSPHAATLVIGLAFLAMLALVGAWVWTDAVADLARGATSGLVPRLLLAASLLLGAVLGAWAAGRLRTVPVTPRHLARCLAGGFLMGFGSMLIPGSNDGLLLLGMPLLWPSAWVALGVMAATIALAMRLQKRFVEGALSVGA